MKGPVHPKIKNILNIFLSPVKQFIRLDCVGVTCRVLERCQQMALGLWCSKRQKNRLHLKNSTSASLYRKS